MDVDVDQALSHRERQRGNIVDRSPDRWIAVRASKVRVRQEALGFRALLRGGRTTGPRRPP